MKDICKNYDPQTYGMEPRENHAIFCEWCGGQIINVAGCWRCTNCGWQGCGG